MLTPEQAAKRLNISRSLVYQLAAKRELAHYRVRGKLMFKAEDLDAYLESCRVEAQAPSPINFTHSQLPSEPLP